jgi:hypothetical protein
MIPASAPCQWNRSPSLTAATEFLRSLSGQALQTSLRQAKLIAINVAQHSLISLLPRRGLQQRSRFLNRPLAEQTICQNLLPTPLTFGQPYGLAVDRDRLFVTGSTSDLAGGTQNGDVIVRAHQFDSSGEVCEPMFNNYGFR